MVMKKFLSLSMLAIAAMVAYSCEVEIEPTVKEKAFEPKVISAFTDDDVRPDTKTSLSGVSILWADTDNIKGYDGSSIHTSTSTAVTNGGKKASFTFSTVSVEDDLLYIAYPAENVTDIDADYVYATIPTTQIATAGSFANGANIAVANGKTTDPVFKNVGGLLSFIINNDDIVSVTLSANEELTGSSIISLGNADFAESAIDEGKKFVTVSGSIANGSTYYAVVYPGTYTGLKIEVRNSAGDIATYENPNALTVDRNSNLFIAELTIPAGKWVTPTKGSSYSWDLASGDLGPNTSPYTPATSVSKGSPSLTWNAAYVWKSSSWFGNDNAKGVQVGASANPCYSAVLSTTGYSGYVESIRVNFSMASSGGASLAVKVGDTSLTCGGKTSVNATTSAAAYVFTSTMLEKGNIELIFSNDKDKALYIKSVEINPELRAPVTLSFDQASIERTTSNYNAFVGQIANASPNESVITSNIHYSISNNTIGTINSSSGVVTLNGTIGDATVTASFDGDSNYAPAQASYDISVISANIDYSTRQTSNVTLSTEGGTNASSAEVNSYAALKAGKSSDAGAVKITVPANTTNIHLHAAGWNGESVVLSITGATAYPSKISLTSNTGISGNTPFTLSDEDSQSNDPADYYFNIEVPGIVSETQLTFTATSGKRFVIWGVNATEEEDNRSESDILWKKAGVGSSTDTASIEDADDVLPTIALYNPNGLPVLYSSSDPGVAEIVESGVNAGTITLISDGETTISAVFNGNASYKPTTVTYTLTVSDNRSSYAFTTIAGLNGLVTNSSNNYSGYLTDAVVSFVPATNTAIVKDATGSVMIYKSGHGLHQGQTYTGTITVTAFKYNNLYSEITAWTGASFSGSESPVDPESLTLSALIGHFSEYQNAYVQVSGLTVNSIDGKNIHVSDGVNSYVVFDNPGTATCAVNDVITAVGTITKYDSTEELKVWKASDITITSYAPRAITFSQPTGAAASAGCSFIVKVDDSEITTGTTVASGKTVTLEATEGTDYEFTSWTVTGATVADASSATTTFVMGVSPVSISAAFSSTNGGGTGNPTTASVSISSYASAHSWTDATKYTSVTIDTNVSASVSGGGNTGKYYVNGNNWRLYQNESASITINAGSKTITSLTITYSASNGGTLKSGNTVIASGSAQTPNASSVTYTVGNTGNATNGQVRITAISVTYQ